MKAMNHVAVPIGKLIQEVCSKLYTNLSFGEPDDDGTPYHRR
jgi:hypothetical protein